MKLTWNRFGQHFLYGLYVATVTAFHPVFGSLLFTGFLIYEVIQDWRKGDNSYKDVFGFLVGVSVGAGIAIILKIWKLLS